ncbi:MAG TPA: PAS domain S-box protein [Candidatus Acidoferrum sp.]|nr:PAS domain S-box protein [Candidatus Acidoferrum sp.]
MGQKTFQRKLVAAFGAALIVLACLGVLSYRRVLQEEADQKWVEHTHLVLDTLDEVLRDLTVQESGQSGETIASDELLRKPHDASGSDLRQNLAELRNLTSDNPKQQGALGRLEALIAARMTFADEQSGGNLAAKDRERASKRQMDEIRGLLHELNQEERRLLSKRLEAADSSTRKMKVVFAAGFFLSFLLLAFASLVTYNEIAKRHESEQELRNTQERNRLLFDGNPIPVWAYDLDSLAILDVNAAAVRHYGYSREEFLTLKITDIRPPEEIPALIEDLAKAPEGEEDSGPWKHKKKSGEIIDVDIKSYPLRFAGKKARLVVALDITERKRAGEALRQSEERFRLMVSNVKDYAIFMLDPEGRVISWNDGAKKIKGYGAEEIIGQHFSRFYLPEDLAAGKPALELKVATEEGRFEEEGWRVCKDGSQFWANVVLTALRDESGRLRGFVKVTRDISERRRAEQESLQRNAELEVANRELEAFSYSVSHDLRAPLRGIDGFSQAILEDFAQQLDDTGKDYLRRIRAGTQRMGTLIDDLLDLSRVTRAEIHRETIDLSALANEIAADLRAGQPERKVEFKISAGLKAEGDSRLMRVALQNLLGNSWKFTSKRTQAQIEFGLDRSSGQCTYFVRDNGAGFEQAYVARLFGAFQRLHSMNEFPGTGIGLATVQRIVHRHGGKVWAEGLVDRGATIYFTL